MSAGFLYPVVSVAVPQRELGLAVACPVCGAGMRPMVEHHTGGLVDVCTVATCQGMRRVARLNVAALIPESQKAVERQRAAEHYARHHCPHCLRHKVTCYRRPCPVRAASVKAWHAERKRQRTRQKQQRAARARCDRAKAAKDARLATLKAFWQRRALELGIPLADGAA